MKTNAAGTLPHAAGRLPHPAFDDFPKCSALFNRKIGPIHRVSYSRARIASIIHSGSHFLAETRVDLEFC